MAIAPQNLFDDKEVRKLVQSITETQPMPDTNPINPFLCRISTSKLNWIPKDHEITGFIHNYEGIDLFRRIYKPDIHKSDVGCIVESEQTGREVIFVWKPMLTHSTTKDYMWRFESLEIIRDKYMTLLIVDQEKLNQALSNICKYV